MCNCLKCDFDVSDLVNWSTLIENYIECPNCKHKMSVEFDESYNGEEEVHFWWLENYTKE